MNLIETAASRAGLKAVRVQRKPNQIKDNMPRIEKRHLDNLDGEPDKIYGSFKELRDEYVERGESKGWTDAFISILESRGNATDRFAQYKVAKG